MMQHSRLWQRLVGSPLLLEPTRAGALLSVMSSIHSVNGKLDMGDGGQDISMFFPSDEKSKERKIFGVAGPLAVVPVIGSLVHKNGLNPSSGMTGYDGISQKIKAAVADPDVSGIFLDIDSPGGEVSGCFDLADQIREARESKPVWAICNEVAYSSAYAIAAQASRIIVPRTGGVGSIGVVTMHADWSVALAKDGIDVTLIHAGAHKVGGNPYERLPENVRDDIQARVDEIYDLFLTTVSLGRGKSKDQFQATEAKTFMGEAAVGAGLADSVMSPNEAVQAFLDHLAGAGPLSSLTTEGMNAMRDKPEDTPQDGVDENAIRADASKAAATRIQSILSHENAKGREDLANHLAFEQSDMSADAAIALLEKSPKAAETTASGDPLALAMSAEGGNPVIGSGDAAGDGEGTPGQALLAAVETLNAKKVM